jgi:hypothetical protein
VGFNLGWVGFERASHVDVLKVLGLRDTGRADGYFEADYSGAQVSGGWYVVIDKQFALFAGDAFARISHRARIVCVAMGEGFGMSVAYEWVNGREIWSIEHDANVKDDLRAEGALPAQFVAIRDRQAALQRNSHGVDYLFDVPIEVANTILPFRPDKMPALFGPRFMELRKG